jgi:hypothetical protein
MGWWRPLRRTKFSPEMVRALGLGKGRGLGASAAVECAGFLAALHLCMRHVCVCVCAHPCVWAHGCVCCVCVVGARPLNADVGDTQGRHASDAAWGGAAGGPLLHPTAVHGEKHHGTCPRVGCQGCDRVCRRTCAGCLNVLAKAPVPGSPRRALGVSGFPSWLVLPLRFLAG